MKLVRLVSLLGFRQVFECITTSIVSLYNNITNKSQNEEDQTRCYRCLCDTLFRFM